MLNVFDFVAVFFVLVFFTVTDGAEVEEDEEGVEADKDEVLERA